MSFVLKCGDLYFAGWGILGEQKFSSDKSLAYRMLYPVATRTAEKIPGSIIEEIGA